MTDSVLSSPAPAPTGSAPASAHAVRGDRPKPGRHRAAAPRMIRRPGRAERSRRASRSRFADRCLRVDAAALRRRSVVLVTTVLSALGITGTAGQAAAAEPGATGIVTASSAGVPAAIQPPAGVVRVATYRVAVGWQIYRCAKGAWTFKAPAAFLLRDRNWRRSIHHFGGPSWRSNSDGSLVTAAKVAEAAVAGTIPQLLLQVNSHSGDPRGELARVSFIQRLNTRGGVAPTGACTDGAERPVRYGADYVFFAPR